MNIQVLDRFHYFCTQARKVHRLRTWCWGRDLTSLTPLFSYWCPCPTAAPTCWGKWHLARANKHHFNIGTHRMLLFFATFHQQINWQRQIVLLNQKKYKFLIKKCMLRYLWSQSQNFYYKYQIIMWVEVRYSLKNYLQIFLLNQIPLFHWRFFIQEFAKNYYLRMT